MELTSYPGRPVVESDISPRLRDKVWTGGLGMRLYYMEL